MENWKNLNISSQITQHSYQIMSQTRWHPLGIDKTYIQYSVQGSTCFVSCVGTNNEQWANMLELKSINNYFKSSNRGKSTVYLDRIHQYLYAVKFL